MASQRALRVVAVAAVLAALLSGCSEKREASHTLPTTGAVEASKTLPPLGPAAFPVPADARAMTPEGALAFGKYYIALGTEVGKGKAPSQALLDLSTPECRLCNQVAKSFSDDQAAGYKQVGGSYSFKEYGPPLMSEGGHVAEIGFDYTQGAYSVIDAKGQEVPSRAGKESGLLRSGMRLDWRNDLHSWLVANLTIG